MTVRIRDCVEDDLEAALAIYDQLVATTTIAWTERATTMAEWVEWFAQRQARRFPVLVADDAGVVVGVASYGDFRDTAHWEGYRYTVELSIHVRGDRHGAGIGRRLVEALVDRARAAGLHVMVAAVDGDNEGSIRFHERLGFVEVARMPEVGFKFGRRLELVLLQRILT